MPAAFGLVFERAELMRAGDDANAALLEWRIIEMYDAGDHRIAIVRKVRLVLMHRKWRTVFRRFDEQLVVMKLYIGRAHDVGHRACEALVTDQTGEHR